MSFIQCIKNYSKLSLLQNINFVLFSSSIISFFDSVISPLFLLSFFVSIFLLNIKNTFYFLISKTTNSTIEKIVFVFYSVFFGFLFVTPTIVIVCNIDNNWSALSFVLFCPLINKLIRFKLKQAYSYFLEKNTNFILELVNSKYYFRERII